jgi:hypothetical protein
LTKTKFHSLISFKEKSFCEYGLRYIFIFKLKNPAAFHDDFWSYFLNIWVIGFSVISEIILYRLPGRNSIYFYICTGKFISTEEAAKKWHHVSLLSLSAIVIQILISLRILLFKRKNRIDPNITENLKLYEKSTMFDLTTMLCNVVVASLAIFLTWKVNSTPPKELNSFPNYLMEYFFRLVGPTFFSLALVVLHYCRNPKIMSALLTELKCNINAYFN